MTRSISAIYYKLDNQWMFPAALIGLSVPLIVACWGSSLVAMAGSFIIFTGIAADTRSYDAVEKVHVVGATGGMVLAGAAMISFGFWYLAAIMLAVSLYLKFAEAKNHTYWIELVVFLATIVGVFMKLS